MEDVIKRIGALGRWPKEYRNPNVHQKQEQLLANRLRVLRKRHMLTPGHEEELDRIAVLRGSAAARSVETEEVMKG